MEGKPIDQHLRFWQPAVSEMEELTVSEAPLGPQKKEAGWVSGGNSRSTLPALRGEGRPHGSPGSHKDPPEPEFSAKWLEVLLSRICLLVRE